MPFMGSLELSFISFFYFTIIFSLLNAAPHTLIKKKLILMLLILKL
jgi:hypothetical protein